MILDIGCPKSLMGVNEYRKLITSHSKRERDSVVKFFSHEKFKFGPSKLYSSKFRVEIPIKLQSLRVIASFFVIDGNIPILIGNDILEALGGIIKTLLP